jgi:hypothetical protein
MVDELSNDVRKLYAHRIISLWLECLDFAQEAQKFFLRGETENEITLEYIARLVQLWRELGPKVKSRAELKELEDEFMSFEQYSREPKLLLSDPDKIIALESAVRNVLDKLQLTSIENVR